ncbi:uncharacterized protein LOC130735891 [Lotus japonicus]|uniref:uncharacterized protein LOC130735891 n=1 Tax=Lotus japonicus TaxID=34305 RepID=UPI00258B7E19|nr:uncharacterized protein LOC130735891 [Lotus japonicus]
MEKKQQQISNSPWDCGSALYDSFELNSFKRQLDSAIANSHRTLSMSGLPERRRTPPEPTLRPPPSDLAMSRKPFKISRSFHRFLRSVLFKSSKSTTTSYQVPENYTKDGFYMVYEKSTGSVLSTISEVPEFEFGATALSPEISSLVRRSASERFITTTTINIACA